MSSDLATPSPSGSDPDVASAPDAAATSTGQADKNTYEFTWGKELDSKSKIRLQMLSRSALAAATSDEFDFLPSHPQRSADEPARLLKHRKDLVEKIQLELSTIEKLGKQFVGLDWPSYILARAVTLTALGRGHIRLGKFAEALEAFDRAILLLPDYLDPYLHRAKIRLKDLPRSAQYAEADLMKALSLSPSNQRAHYLMGKLFFNPSIARYEDAEKHLLQADLLPMSYFIRAEICAQQHHDLASAIDLLSRSLNLDNRIDFRMVRFVEYVLAFTKLIAPLAKSEAAVDIPSAYTSPAPTKPSSPAALTPGTAASTSTVHTESLLEAAKGFATSLSTSERKKYAERGKELRNEVEQRLGEFKDVRGADPDFEIDDDSE